MVAPRTLLLSLVMLAGAVAPPAALAGEPPMIAYRVTLPERQAHQVHVELTVDGVTGPALELGMPVWTPGSYLVREFERNVLELAATDGEGRALAVDKPDKNTWHVTTGGAGRVVVTYALYANERSVRTSHVDADHAFLSPAGTFLFVRGRQHEANRVLVEAPEGWQVFTGLAPDGDGFVAADYDELVDGPLEAGPHRMLSFELDGVPHRIVLAGEGAVDGEQLVEDVRRVTAEVSSILGFLPFERYTFLLQLVDAGGGGLEHRNSSVCMTSRWDLDDPEKHRRLLSLIAHEYFHAWNVKRFRPAALGPFDYDRENYTPDLWVAEGITSYYDDLCTLRAGYAEKVESYLDARAGAFRKEAERPGARRMSLAESSRDAWIKLYRSDENSANSSISYYSKGALVALLLDLRLRRLTDGEHTLADVLRLGWQRYTEQGTGYPPGAIATLAGEVAGADLSDFFSRYVQGTAPLEPDEDLAWVGLHLAIRPGKAPDHTLPTDDRGFPLRPDLGLTTRDRNGLCRVDTVLEGGAAWRAGLNHDDLLLAVDDMRVTAESLQDRLDRTAGAPVGLTFYRGQSLRRLTVTPELTPVTEWKLLPVDAPTDAQQQAFRDWTGWNLPAPPADGS